MGVILNRSGVLHVSARCAGSGTLFWIEEGETLLGFLYYRFTGLCRRCCR